MGKIVSNAHEAKVVAHQHEGVPPVGVFVTITYLESADGASCNECARFGERQGGGFRDVTVCGEFGNDFCDLRAMFYIAK